MFKAKNIIRDLVVAFLLITISNIYIIIKTFNNLDMFNAFLALLGGFSSGFIFGLLFTVRSLQKINNKKNK